MEEFMTALLLDTLLVLATVGGLLLLRTLKDWRRLDFLGWIVVFVFLVCVVASSACLFAVVESPMDFVPRFPM